MTKSPSQSESLDLQALLDWIDKTAAQLREQDTAGLLTIGGVDALNVLVSPLFVQALNTLRTGVGDPFRTRGRVLGRLRKLASRWRDRTVRTRSALPGSTDVLLWPREITHLAVFAPIEHELCAHDVTCRTFTCQRKAFLEAAHVLTDTVFAQAVWPDTVRAARREGRSRAQQLAGSHFGPLSPFPHRHGELLANVVHETIAYHLAAVVEAVENARLALDKFSPRVLVVGNDITLEGRAACLIAAQRSVPTASFMHGNITGGILQSKHIVDRFIVQGDLHRQDLLSRGLRAEQIAVCGAPHLDGRTPQSGQIDPKLQAAFGLQPGEPWILVATSGPGNLTSYQHHEVIIQQLARLAAAFPKVKLVIKLHRKDRVDSYRALIESSDPSRVFVVPKSDPRVPYDIFEWLQGCRIVLTTTSTVAVEAMLMNVPVVTMDFCHEARQIDFIDAGATTHVQTPEELEQAVGAILAGGPSPDVAARARQYVEAAFFQVDGRAAERGAAEICRLGGIAWNRTVHDSAVSQESV